MRTILFLAIALIALPTFADNLRGYYAGAAIDFVDGNATDAEGNNVGFRVLEFNGGYKYNSWLGGELRLGIGASGESYSVNEGGSVVEGEVDIDHFESIYYRAESSNTVAKIYGLIGYSNIQTSASFPGGTTSASKSGPSYGFGVGFVMNEKTNLNFEYRQIINTDDSEFTTVSLGFDYRF